MDHCEILCAQTPGVRDRFNKFWAKVHFLKLRYGHFCDFWAIFIKIGSWSQRCITGHTWSHCHVIGHTWQPQITPGNKIYAQQRSLLVTAGHFFIDKVTKSNIILLHYPIWWHLVRFGHTWQHLVTDSAQQLVTIIIVLHHHLISTQRPSKRKGRCQPALPVW